MKLTRTAAERVVEEWFRKLGYLTHRARASRIYIPTGGTCPTCHRPFTKTLNISQDLFTIFDGVSVLEGAPTVWWQVTTVSHKDELGPLGGTDPNYNSVSQKKAKIRDMAGRFAPDPVWILGASTVRRHDNRRLFRRYFQVWVYDYLTKTWQKEPWTLDVDVSTYGSKPWITTMPNDGILDALGRPPAQRSEDELPSKA